MSKKNLLILCTGNSCRSQMAEGWLRQLAGDKFNVFSAGIEVHGLNPKAVASMKKIGIDISQHSSNHLDEYKNVDFDYIITVCDHAQEHCPYFPSKALRTHHNFPDPAKATGSEATIEKSFDDVRDLIGKFCEQWVLDETKTSE